MCGSRGRVYKRSKTNKQSNNNKNEPAGDVEGHEHINTVMLVSGQDEENTKAITEPGEGVQEVNSPAAGIESRSERSNRSRRSRTC